MRLLLAAALMALLGAAAAHAQYICPDGSYVAKGPCTICPDGSYIGSGARCAITPKGDYVEKTPAGPAITPDGDYVPGGRGITLCPDGTYVAGSRCVIMPDGSYRGR